MTAELVTFHERGGLYYAFLGVHIVGMASEAGKWMSVLDGDMAWRRGAGDVAGAKAALSRHVLEWYDAAHQPLAAGQAERLCEQRKPRPRPQETIKIRDVDPQALVLRLKREGVVTTYVLPPAADKSEPPRATLEQARMYCVSAAEIAENKMRAVPSDELAAHECAVFAGLLRLIDACASSPVIKNELRRMALARTVVPIEAARPESIEDAGLQ